jgi:membrane protein YqaA with SNARE-associated domain
LSAYIILFWSAFGAATILPFYSEVVLLAYLEAGYDPAGLFLAATVGNTLGAVVNWAIGWHVDHLLGRRWFPVTEAQLERARRWFYRYGYWSLLLAWLPVGGDALTFVGGIMRVRLATFILLVGFGKAARYAAIVLGWGALPGH